MPTFIFINLGLRHRLWPYLLLLLVKTIENLCYKDLQNKLCHFYSINQWKKEKNECPICRKAIAACTKHVEMDNFVTKIHTLLSQDIQNRRKDLEIERENTVRIADEEEARRPISDINEYLHEINGFYSNVRFLGHDLVSMEDRVSV